MNRKAFHQLLKNYVEGKSTEAERRLLDQWYELLDDDSLENIQEAELDSIEQRLWNKIQDQTAQADQPKNKPAFVRKIWTGWAAAAVVGICALLVFMWGGASNNVSLAETTLPDKGMIKANNTTGKPLPIKLEDGSVVTLQPGAILSYATHFAAEKREVYLQGEAFFDVSKNAARPFYVYNNNLVTQVLGTSFNVKINKETKQVEVAVRTGKVIVYENGPDAQSTTTTTKNNGVLLTPNQKVIYHANGRHFVTTLVDAPLPVAVEELKQAAVNPFLFEDTPLSEVLEMLESAYNIHIQVENENLNKCPFTGEITDENLFTKLEFICQSIHAAYEIKGTSILIKGSGCN
mgnify:CR=1 FL=1